MQKLNRESISCINSLTGVKRRQRASKDLLRNLGSPQISTRKVVIKVQAVNPRGLNEGSMDGGVSRSSEEASNDRGAKG